MDTCASLEASDSVRKLQTALHANVKEDRDFRFYAPSVEVWRQDMAEAAWWTVRRKGGPAVWMARRLRISRSAARWLVELRPDSCPSWAVRQVLIPKKQPWRFRLLGIHLE